MKRTCRLKKTQFPNQHLSKIFTRSFSFCPGSIQGMSLHTIQVPYDQTTVTLEVIPDFFNTTQYALLVRYKHPPKWNETDHKWIVPYNISLGSKYLVFLAVLYLCKYKFLFLHVVKWIAGFVIVNGLYKCCFHYYYYYYYYY